MAEKIRWSRVLLGGFVAGVVVNLFLLAPGWLYSQIFRALPPDVRTVLSVAMAVLAFLMTIMVTWCYAVVRGRLKPGFGAAAILGVGLGLLLAVLLYLGWRVILGTVPVGIWILNAGVAFAALVIASVLGAWIYEKPSR
jgi:hypothetical protein